MNSYIYKSMINRVMHSDVFKAEEDWTKSQQNDFALSIRKWLVLQAYAPKSQQNDWLLGLLYIWKMMYQYLPSGGAIWSMCIAKGMTRIWEQQAELFR